MAHTYYHSWGVHSAVKLQFHICNIGEFISGHFFRLYLSTLLGNVVRHAVAACRIRMTAHYYYFSRPFPCHFVYFIITTAASSALFRTPFAFFSLSLSLRVLARVSSSFLVGAVDRNTRNDAFGICVAVCYLLCMLVTVIIIIIIKWMENSLASHIECLFDFNK